jgi:hypothetical protein
MYKRISDAEIYYLFGRVKKEEVETIFALLVNIEDAISKKTRKDLLQQALSALLAQPQPEVIEKFIKRLLQVEPRNAIYAAQVATQHVFTPTHHYNSALSNRQKKARAAQEKQTP